MKIIKTELLLFVSIFLSYLDDEFTILYFIFYLLKIISPCIWKEKNHYKIPISKVNKPIIVFFTFQYNESNLILLKINIWKINPI